MTEFNFKTPVGPPGLYDYSAALQFSILFNFGLRSCHKFLDFGCGSLRLGRLLIQYLHKGNYYGIEPREDLVAEGIKGNHLQELVNHKKPHLRISGDCNMSAFGIAFDYILAYSIFTHMPIKQTEASLKSVCQAMHKDTIFLATYFEGKVDDDIREWSPNGVERRWETMSRIIHANKLLVTRLNLTGSGRQVWLLIRRPS